MTIESLSVEELSREMKRNKMIAIQEVTHHRPRQWLFQGERLTQLREQFPANADFPDGAEIFLVCHDSDTCQQYAERIANKGWTVRYLAGGHLAWNQFYHPVVVGFDEQVKVWQIHRLSRGCLSYMVTSGDEAMIVDPSYHIDYYLGLAHAENVDISCVVDTTVHRDHVSGAARLAAKTGSPYYVPSDERFQGESRPLEEQSTLPLGGTPIDVIVLPNINSQMDLSVGLFYGDRFFLSGDQPIRHEAFRRSVEAHSRMREASEETIVLPAHTGDIALVNEHGIVGALLGELKKDALSFPKSGISIDVRKPEAMQDEIVKINLTQEKIDLGTANELEMGISR